MKWLFFLLSVLLASAAPAKESKVMNHTEVRPEKILGALGKPLGTVLTITGEVASGDELRTKAMAGKLLLRVTSVQGQKLAAPVLVEFEIPPWARVARPAVGQAFSYLGYETGGMGGIPFAVFEHLPPMTTDGFSFRIHFVVCKEVKS